MSKAPAMHRTGQARTKDVRLPMLLLVLLGSAFWASPQTAIVTVALITSAGTFVFWPSLRQFALSLSLISILGAQLLSLVFGLKLLPLILLLIVGMAFWFLQWTNGVAPLQLRSFVLPQTVVAFTAICMTIGVSKFWNPLAGVSWVMSGDAINQIVMQRVLAGLSVFEVFEGYFPGWAIGHALLVNGLAGIESIQSGPPLSLTALLETNVALVLVGFAVGANQLLIRTSWVRISFGKSLVQGAILGVVLISGAFMGLVASNGFLTVAVVFAFYSTFLISLGDLLRKPSLTNWAVSGTAVLALGLSWQPLGILAFSVLIVVAVRPARRYPVGIALFAPAIGFICAKLLYPGPQQWLSSGYFPIVPLAAFAAYVMFLLAAGSRTRSPGPDVNLAISLGLGGLVGVTIFFGYFDPFAFFGHALRSGVTDYYYSFKLLWIVTLPLVVYLLAYLVPDGIRGGGVSAPASVAALGFLLLSINIGSNVRFAPFVSMFGDERLAVVAEEVFSQPGSSPPAMYFRLHGWEIDSTLNGWSGIAWEPVAGEGTKIPAPGPFANRVSWYQGDNIASLCAGLDLLPAKSRLVTVDASLPQLVSIHCVGMPEHLSIEVRAARVSGSS